MEYEKYAELKNEIEIYFAKNIKKRFQEFIAEKYELHFAPDYLSHSLISDLLSKDGLEVYGMNVNMDGFQVLLDFNHDYLAIDNFPFTRLSVDFKNDGNYSVYLGENSFDDDWTVHLEDEYSRYRMLKEEDFLYTLNEMKNTHLVFILKS
jgi:hypothetical protein